MTRSQRALLALIVGLLLLAGGQGVLAQGPVDPYRSYTVDGAGRAIPIPDPYVPHHVIQGMALGIGDFATPSDIFIDRTNDHLYIVDMANDRIVELDDQWRVVRQLGAELELKAPEGIFRDQSDSLETAPRNEGEGRCSSLCCRPCRYFGPF